jgi:hypothetical protein
MTESIDEHSTMSEQHRAALAAAKAEPIEQHPRLITTRTGRALVHGTSSVGRFNSWLAVMITKGVGTMWAAYLFVLIGLVSLPQALRAFLHGDTVTGIAWLSQSFLQLVLLPIIIVGQNVIAASQDARAEADHVTLTVLHTINVRQLTILEQQQKILDMLQQKTS